MVLDFQRDLAEAGSDSSIFITGHGDIPMTVKAMQSGCGRIPEEAHSGIRITDAIHQASIATGDACKQQSETWRSCEALESREQHASARSWAWLFLAAQ